MSTISMMVSAAALAASPSAAGNHLLSTGEIFLLFFIMLGPLKVIGPFFVATHELAEPAVRKIALRVFVLALITTVVGGLLGSFMIGVWHITVPILLVAGGLVFLLVALQMVLEQYRIPTAPSTATGPVDERHLLFPVTVSPYGLAALIILVAANSSNVSRQLLVFGLAIAVLILDLLAMIFARVFMKRIGPVPLLLLGALLGILQVALAIAILLRGLATLGVVSLSAPI